MIADAHHLDLLMADAWPARLVEPHDGWIVRYTDGVTRRANSVLCLGQPADVDAAVRAGEEFYRSHGAPAVFLVTDVSTPDAVLRALEGHGYAPTAPTGMLVADAVEVANRTTPGCWQLGVEDEPGDEWFEVYWAVERPRRACEDDARVLREQLLQPPRAARFIEVRDDDGRVAAVAEVVIDGGWGCGQCLATATWARRRGAGGAAVHAMATAAIEAGANRLFVAVMDDNVASNALCASVGFTRTHGYRYYVRPDRSDRPR